MRALVTFLAFCLLAAPAAAQEVVGVESPSMPGEIWPCGAGCRIEWWSHRPDIWNRARVQLSIDGKQSWFTLAECIPNLGGWNWTVPARTESDRCYIRVDAAWDCETWGRMDINDDPFIITEGPTATVLPIEADSLVSGGCIDVSLEVENHSGRQLTLWYDLDMADPALNIHDDPANDLQFTIGAGDVKTVTRPFCMPWGVPEGTWTLKAILWSVRDGDRYAGPKLYDSGWIHPTTVATWASSWGAVKAAGGTARR